MERDNLLKKITSPNGGIFTGAGTNSYLIGKKDITLVDPGPNIPKHLDKLVEKADNNIKRILVTHTHMDHSPGAKPLAERLSIPAMENWLKMISQFKTSLSSQISYCQKMSILKLKNIRLSQSIHLVRL